VKITIHDNMYVAESTSNQLETDNNIYPRKFI